MTVETNLTSGLIHAARQCRALRAAHLRTIGLHAGQDELLQCLGAENGLSMGELAEALDIKPPTVSKMVARMETRGLVRREASPSDVRKNLVFLTDAGSRLLEELQTAWQAVETLAFEGLKEKDTRRLAKLLARIGANLQQASTQADG